MEILVTTILEGPSGQPQRSQRRIPGSVFTVGRGTQCHVHLPDARVALVHARISVSDSGALIEASPHRVIHNEVEVDGARLAVGDVIEIGPYVLIIEPAPKGVALALSVRLSKRAATKGDTALYRILMIAPPLSKRRLSYLAFFGVLAVALAAPIASDLLEEEMPEMTVQKLDPHSREALRALGVGLVQAWNPGPLSRSHATFGQDCHACHEMRFIQVRDQACAACHSGVRDHVPKGARRGAVAGVLDEARCAGCHRDHKGHEMAPRAQPLCTQCHATVQIAQTHRASDFAFNHPEFRVPKVERTNLKFNHSLHLDPAGVRDPRATAKHGKSVLACENCHLPQAGGVRMVPVTMEKHCGQCHALTFDPKVTTRVVPHGPVEEVERMLREFYARFVLDDSPSGAAPPGDLTRQRIGAAAPSKDRRAVLKVADERAQRTMTELMQTRAVCGTCHHVSRGPKGEWRVAQMEPVRAWMPRSMFTHAKHATQACITCHDVRSSRRAEDVSMPSIARCRECHAGAVPVVGKIASECATCHRFHFAVVR